MILWQTEALNQTKLDAARMFIRDKFPDERRLDRHTYEQQSAYCATFRLIDGIRTYQVKYVPAKRFERVARFQVSTD